MEDNKAFVDETDYKALWKYCNEKREEAEALASARLDRIEDLERELAEKRREVVDLEFLKTRTDETIMRLNGEVSGLQYAIRYYMVGDGR